MPIYDAAVAPGAPRAGRSHANNFDAIRLLAALVVMASHQLLVMGINEPQFQSFAAGAYAVMVFFVISGYLVAHSWHQDPHLVRFATRRLLRIWPALAAVVIVSAAIVASMGEPARGGRYLANLVFVFHDEPTFTDHRPYLLLNGALWTIPFEVGCYAVVAASGVLLRKHLRWFGLAAFASGAAWYVLAGAQTAFNDAHRETFPYFLFWGSFFLLGALLQSFPLGGRVLVLGVLVAILLNLFGEPLAATWLFIPCATVLVGRASWPVVYRASRFGDLSYGTYLWGLPAEQLVLYLVGFDDYFKLLGYSVALTLVVAGLSWHLIEKRALRLKPKAPSEVPTAPA